MNGFEQKVHAAIDISKDNLDVFHPSTPRTRRFANDARGIAKLLDWLEALGVKRLEFEASGGYEKALEHSGWERAMELCLLNPLRVRDYARSRGALAKTDAIDARMIYDYAQAFAQELRVLKAPTPNEALLRAYVLRRQQLVDNLKREQCRSHQAAHSTLRSLIEAEIAHIRAQIKQLELQIRELIHSEPVLKDKAQRIGQVKGAGPVLTAVLLARMPELGTLNRKQVAALAGLAPFNRDSGQMRGHRTIQAGRYDVRKTLFMAALAAIIHNPALKIRYKALRARGKPAKLALTACMRCLLIEINAALRPSSFLAA